MDEEFFLTTPENVPIYYELAGLGSRFWAAILDSLIMTAVQIGLLVIVVMAGGFATSTSRPWSPLLWIYFPIAFALYLAYPLLFEVTWSGQTPGKRKAGIRIIQDEGGPLTAMNAVVRNVIRLIDFLPVYYILGVVVMLIDRKGRRLGDLAASTICVRERRDVHPDRAINPASAYGRKKTWPHRPPLDQLGRLSPDDRRLIREYLLRRDRLASEAAQDLAVRIADRISSNLGIALGDEPAGEFIERVGSEMDGHSPSPNLHPS